MEKFINGLLIHKLRYLNLYYFVQLPQTEFRWTQWPRKNITKRTKLNNLGKKRKVFLFYVSKVRSFWAWVAKGTAKIKSSVEQLWMLEEMLLFLIKPSQVLLDSLVYKLLLVILAKMLNEASLAVSRIFWLSSFIGHFSRPISTSTPFAISSLTLIKFDSASPNVINHWADKNLAKVY